MKVTHSMPMMTWISLHPVDNAPSWMWWVVLGILAVGIAAIVAIAIKFK